MATIAVSALLGGVAGALIGGAIYFLDDQEHPAHIGYWAAGGVLVGTGVGIVNVATDESRAERAVSSRTCRAIRCRPTACRCCRRRSSQLTRRVVQDRRPAAGGQLSAVSPPRPVRCLRLGRAFVRRSVSRTGVVLGVHPAVKPSALNFSIARPRSLDVTDLDLDLVRCRGAWASSTKTRSARRWSRSASARSPRTPS